MTIGFGLALRSTRYGRAIGLDPKGAPTTMVSVHVIDPASKLVAHDQQPFGRSLREQRRDFLDRHIVLSQSRHLRFRWRQRERRKA